MDSFAIFIMFSTFMVLLFSGYPVAFVLGGTGVLFAALGTVIEPLNIVPDVAELRMVGFVANRVFDTLSSYSLVPMSMFIFMGFMLDRSGIAEKLLKAMRRVLGPMPGGLAIAVVLIGMVLAASTGIIGASVVLLATIALPTMFEAGYARWLSLGTVGATGCLGILVPPSIMLVVMGDQLRIPVGDLFMGAMVPGALLALSFILFIIVVAIIKPSVMPPYRREQNESGQSAWWEFISALVAPLALVLAVLGSIVAGIASPTEASGIGAAGASLLALANGRLNWADVKDVCYRTGRTTAFLYALIFGASCFSVVLRGYGGDEVIENALNALPLGPYGLLTFIMLVIFALGFFLDWMEIVLIVAPLVMPVLTVSGFDPVWVAILMALCLQSSFLTPPVGMALFYLRSSTDDVKMSEIYKGALPFVGLQLLTLLIVALFPALALWLPNVGG